MNEIKKAIKNEETEIKVKNKINDNDYTAWRAYQCNLAPADLIAKTNPDEDLRKYLRSHRKADRYFKEHKEGAAPAYEKELRYIQLDVVQIVNLVAEYNAETWDIMHRHYIDHEIVEDIARTLHLCPSTVYNYMADARAWLLATKLKGRCFQR